jgi:hypothetical protein
MIRIVSPCIFLILLIIDGTQSIKRNTKIFKIKIKIKIKIKKIIYESIRSMIKIQTKQN